MYTIPNGGYWYKTTAAILKLTDVKVGVPDIFLPAPKGIYHGLFIEMKIKGNRPKEAQKKYIAYLFGAGYKTAVCYGCDEAIETIKEYLDKQYASEGQNACCNSPEMKSQYNPTFL